MDRKMLLQRPSEQSRLLHEVPEIIADVVEAELTFEDSSRKDKQGCLPELAHVTSELPCTDLKGKGTSCYPNGGKYPAAFVAPVKAVQFHVPIPEEKQQSEGSLYKKSTEQFHKFAPDVKGNNILQREQHHSRALLPEVLPQGSLTFTPEVKQHRSKSLLLEELPQKSRTFALEGHCDVISPKISQERTNEKKQNMSAVEFIELSDDDEQILNHAPRKQAIENTGCSVWYCVGPHGEKRGPFSMSVLKRWSDTNSPLNFKVWKKDQSEQDAVSLTEALSQNFPQN